VWTLQTIVPEQYTCRIIVPLYNTLRNNGVTWVNETENVHNGLVMFERVGGWSAEVCRGNGSARKRKVERKKETWRDTVRQDLEILGMGENMTVD